MAQSKEKRESLRADVRSSMADAADQAQQSIERLESAFGAFWAEAAGDEAQPYLREMARLNMEMIGLVGRRTRAFAELPARLVACQTPQDFWAEQFDFLRHSLSDYQSATGRMMEAMQAATLQQTQQLSAQSRSNGRGRQSQD